MGLVPVKGAAKVTDHRGADVRPRLHRYENALAFRSAGVVAEADHAVDTPVHPLLPYLARCLTDRASADELKRPPLKLVRVRIREHLGAGGVHGLPVNLEVDPGEGRFETVTDERDRKVRDVDADPLTLERLRRMHSGPTSAERIEHNIALVRGRVDNAL